MSVHRAIPLSAGMQSGFDELSGANALFINGVVEREGVRARPGIEVWDGFPVAAASTKPVLAVAVFMERVVYVTSDGHVWAVKDGVAYDLSETTAQVLNIITRPKIVASGNVCLIVAGGRPLQVTTTFAVQQLNAVNDVGAAVSVPFFIDATYIASRIVGIVADSGYFYWSGILDPGIEVWDELAFAEASAQPDNNVAIGSNSNELWILGEETIQIFVPDENLVFIKQVSADHGGKGNLVTMENEVAFIDHRRHIQVSDGRNFGDSSEISADIQRELDNLAVTSDVWGFHCHIDQHVFVVFVFPTVGRAFAYDMQSKTWAEWRGFERGQWCPLRFNAYCFWPSQGIHLVGLNNGKIGQLTFAATDDVGEILACQVRTGFLRSSGSQADAKAYDTMVPKDPLELTMLLRTGEASSASSAVQVRWRDGLHDGFCDPVTVPLGTVGSFGGPVRVRPVGSPYIMRQYEFTFAAGDAYYLAAASEELEELEA